MRNTWYSANSINPRYADVSGNTFFALVAWGMREVRACGPLSACAGVFLGSILGIGLPGLMMAVISDPASMFRSTTMMADLACVECPCIGLLTGRSCSRCRYIDSELACILLLGTRQRVIL